MTATALERTAKERTALATRPLDIEGVRQLMLMRQELRAEAALEAFNASLALFQSKCPVINKATKVKNAKGPDIGKTRYSYAKLEHIVTTVKPLMKQCGFSYKFDARISERGAVEIVCVLKHVAGHSEESTFEIPIDAQAYMNEPQKFGSASTFAKRYAFCNALGILTGDDDDANSMGEPSAGAKAGPSTITQPRARTDAQANTQRSTARPPAETATSGKAASAERSRSVDQRYTPAGTKISKTQVSDIAARMEDKALSSGDLFKRFNVMSISDIYTSQVAEVYDWIKDPQKG